MSLDQLYRAFKEASMEAIRVASIYIPQDVYNALSNALKNETSDIARRQLEAIIKNIELAASEGKPICQDTGMMFFYIEAGKDFPLLHKIKDILVEAVK